MATLWDIDDDASAVFMEQFYLQLAGGATAAEALRRTKQRLRADPGWNRPSLWSAYVLIGDGSRVVRRAGVPAWGWALGAILLIGVVALIWWFGRARRV